MKVTKVTSKNQITIPIEIRSALAIKPLGESDPIWELVGIGSSGDHDVAEEHDRYLADAEVRG